MGINPLKQRDFLYFYSLQAGVVICSSIGIFLAVAIFIVNLAAENSEVDPNVMIGQYLIIIIYSLGALLGFTISLFAAYQESRRLSIVGSIIQTVMLLYWLLFLFLSFLNKRHITRRICIDNRCPEHLWLQDARWRDYNYFCDPSDARLPVVSVPRRHQLFAGIKNRTSVSDLLNFMKKNKVQLIAMQHENDEDPLSNALTDKFYLPHTQVGSSWLLVASVFLSVLAFVYFVYSITTLISYANELDEPIITMGQYGQYGQYGEE